MIFFLEQIKVIIYDMLKNRLRILLTMTGIIIGVLSVVIIISVGNAAASTVNNYFTGTLGANSITSYINFPASQDSLNYVLTYDEQNDISSRVDGSLGIIVKSPGVIDGQINISREMYTGAVIEGVTPAYRAGTDINMIRGRFISEQDCERSASAAVISDVAAVNCFGSIDEALGKTFVLRNDSVSVEVSVVGVYKYIDTKGKYDSVDDLRKLVTNIYCSYEYVNKCLKVDESKLVYYQMTIIVDDNEKIGNAMFQLNELMSQRRDDPEYSAHTHLGYNEAEAIKKTIGTITLVFVCAAVLLLLAGGINLMNILLVTVKERTKEIGIKKAIGASNHRIVFQFLLESVIICLTACSLGIALSFLTLAILRHNLTSIISLISDEGLRTFLITNGINLKINFTSVITVVAFSLGVSQIFGIYPAYKASQMQITDALRYE